MMAVYNCDVDWVYGQEQLYQNTAVGHGGGEAGGGGETGAHCFWKHVSD